MLRVRSIEFNGLFYKNEKTHFYIIELKEDDSTAEKLKTLIHEIGHVYYNVKGFNPDIEEARSGSFDDLLIIEDLLDEQADIFLRNNPGFAEELIKKYLL